jgi:UDP-2,3-diacylglucosamine pyrophosphatase LpxH
MAIKAHYRTVFLSDLHMGAGGTRAAEAGRFLKRIECDTLYLVGDIIDMWRLKQRWHWPEPNNRVVHRILKMARRGTRVVFIPGNHDEAARRFIGLTFGGVEILQQDSHTTADGRRLLITHGDQFDLVVRHHPLLSAFGAWAYDWLVRLSFRINAIRQRLGKDHWSLSQSIKSRVKSACTFISRFEDALTEEARRGGYQGVVCGHIHKAEMREAGGIFYYNCGDWVESCTALVEHHNGRFELIYGPALIEQIDEERRVARTLRLAQATQETAATA